MIPLPLTGPEAQDLLDRGQLGLAYLDLETLQVLFVNTAAALGGRIQVDGAPGQGTRITVTPPALEQVSQASGSGSAPEQPAPDRPAAGESMGPGKGTVLVVDDEPQVARVLARMLRRAGYQPTLAASVEQAQALLVDGASMDLIICDLMMPGLTGMDLHAWLSETRPDLARRTLFITGGVFTPRAERFLSHAGVCWLEKPVDRGALFKALEELSRGG